MFAVVHAPCHSNSKWKAERNESMLCPSAPLPLPLRFNECDIRHSLALSSAPASCSLSLSLTHTLSPLSLSWYVECPLHSTYVSRGNWKCENFRWLAIYILQIRPSAVGRNSINLNRSNILRSYFKIISAVCAR